MSRARRLASAIGAIAVFGVTPAGAQQAERSQVFVDPESPTGKEYAIPLEAQRRQADPSRRRGAKVVQGEESSPLFGEGIDGSDGEGTGGRGSPGGGNTATTSRSRSPSKALDRTAEEALSAAATRPGAPGSGIGTTLAIVGGAVALLGLGGGIGWALRRRAGA